VRGTLDLLLLLLLLLLPTQLYRIRRQTLLFSRAKLALVTTMEKLETNHLLHHHHFCFHHHDRGVGGALAFGAPFGHFACTTTTTRPSKGCGPTPR
jgi:hypothetical protein